jgi:hypothetical protein
MENKELSTELILSRNFSKLKKLEISEPDIDDVIYNLNCLIGYFNAIEHYGASNTALCAKQIIKSLKNDIN